MPSLQTVLIVLIRFETEPWNAVDARLRADCDLPLSRFAPMQVIARHGSCRVHDIADEMSMTAGGASKLVDRIEASGYCRPAQPRRPAIVGVTPAGTRTLPRATAVSEGELRDQPGTAMIAAIEVSRPGPFAAAVDPRGKQGEDEHTDPGDTIR